MSEWKPGDIVAFTLTGTIAKVSGDMIFIDTPSTQYITNVSQILGTPEQVKRERVIKQLNHEFSIFRFEPMPDDDTHIIIISDHVLLEDKETQYWRERIQARIAELQTQL